MVIELRVVQLWSEIILVISVEITRMIQAQIALHSVQLPLLTALKDDLFSERISNVFSSFENVRYHRHNRHLDLVRATVI